MTHLRVVEAREKVEKEAEEKAKEAARRPRGRRRSDNDKRSIFAKKTRGRCRYVKVPRTRRGYSKRRIA